MKSPIVKETKLIASSPSSKDESQTNQKSNTQLQPIQKELEGSESEAEIDIKNFT